MEKNETGTANNFYLLGDSPGFSVNIKAIPKHFVVDEISNFTGEIPDEALESNKGESLKRKADENLSSNPKRVNNENCDKLSLCAEEKKEEKIVTPVLQDTKFRCDVQWCRNKLGDILPKDSHSQLEALAEKASENQQSSNDNKAESLILGTFISRDERTLLHRCARYVFPQLKTVTTPNAAIVSVQRCPNYFKFCAVIGPHLTDKVLRFILVESAEYLREDVTVEGSFPKEVRRQLHHLIASCYGKFMEARTSPGTEDGISRITIRPKRQTKKVENEDMDGTILAFTLWKKNAETYTAIQQLASHFHLRHNMFNFAGLKDKRAVTTQRCTVCGISQNRFERLCQSLPTYLRVSNIHPVSRVIRLGELDGNRFNIRLTDVRLSDQGNGTYLQTVVASAIESIKKTGFVNYFGPQRFGRRVFSEICGEIDGLVPDLEAPAAGIAMLKGDFEFLTKSSGKRPLDFFERLYDFQYHEHLLERRLHDKRAVTILLSPATDGAPSNETNDADKAKRHFQSTGDIEGTLKMMPQNKMREISILRTLHRFGTNDQNAFAKALLGLPHSSRLLYVHSFCSWVWNKIATTRLRLYGPKPVPGDLAMPQKRETGDMKPEDSSMKDSLKKKVIVVTEDDVISGRVGLEDIVLAVPGNQVCYPPNMKEEYRHLLEPLRRDSETDSITPAFRIPDLKLNAPGAYRRLAAFPRNVTYKFLPPFKRSVRPEDSTSEQNTNKKLQGSVDGEFSEGDTGGQISLSSVTCPLSQSETNDSNAQSTSHCVDSEHSVSKSYDVELQFDLPPSCYATTFLQELTSGCLQGSTK